MTIQQIYFNPLTSPLIPGFLPQENQRPILPSFSLTKNPLNHLKGRIQIKFAPKLFDLIDQGDLQAIRRFLFFIRTDRLFKIIALDRNSSGNTALSLAIEKSDFPLITTLLSALSPKDRLTACQQRDKSESTVLCLALKKDPNLFCFIGGFFPQDQFFDMLQKTYFDTKHDYEAIHSLFKILQDRFICDSSTFKKNHFVKLYFANRILLDALEKKNFDDIAIIFSFLSVEERISVCKKNLFKFCLFVDTESLKIILNGIPKEFYFQFFKESHLLENLIVFSGNKDDLLYFLRSIQVAKLPCLMPPKNHLLAVRGLIPGVSSLCPIQAQQIFCSGFRSFPVHQFTTNHPNFSQALIFRIFADCSKTLAIVLLSAKSIAREILAKKIVVILTGWVYPQPHLFHHVISIVFAGNRMILCNRGDYRPLISSHFKDANFGISEYLIQKPLDFKTVTLAIRLLRNQKDFSWIHEIPKLLALSPKQRSISQKPQIEKMNCSFIAAKSALLAIACIHTNWAPIARTFYKLVTTHDRAQAIVDAKEFDLWTTFTFNPKSHSYLRLFSDPLSGDNN